MQPPTNMTHMNMPFPSNPGSDKRAPPFGGAQMMGQPGQFPSSMMPMFPPGMSNMGGMSGMSGMAGPVSGPMGAMAGGMPMGGISMGGMPMGGMPMGSMSMNPMSHFNIRRNQIKEQEFQKGIFVEDFEQTVTGEMLYKHFNDIKPVSIIKFPTTNERKTSKFAFVYFKTPEDAREVMEIIQKDQEDEEKAIQDKLPQAEMSKLKKRHRILKKAFRVSTLTVNKQSKMMLKPRLESEYFNVRNLKKQIKRILAGALDYKLNKVVIPKDPKDETKHLSYARVFFELSHSNQVQTIKDALERDETFNKHIQVLDLKAPLKNVTMLYVKGFAKPGDNLDNIDNELKDFFLSLNPNWLIVSVWVKSSDQGAWAYITFQQTKQCREAFTMLKSLKTTFKGNVLFANLRNQIDDRAIIMYGVQSHVTHEQLEAFFNKVRQVSQELPKPQGAIEEGTEQSAVKRKKFDFYDINILEERDALRRNIPGTTVRIPRRVVITFMDAMNHRDTINELTGEIMGIPGYKEIFTDKIRVYPCKPFNLAGHLDVKGVHHRHHGRYDGPRYHKNEGAGYDEDKPRVRKFDQRQKRLPVKTGYTPIMNVPRPPGKMGFSGPSAGMNKPGMPGRPYPSMIPTGMGPIPGGANPMAGSFTGKPPIKNSNQSSIGVVGMSMPSNLNPISQMSYASNMRPTMNPMGGNPMGGNPMGGNPMNSMMGMPNPMGNPMGNSMSGNPMGGNFMNPMMGMSNQMGNMMPKPSQPTPLQQTGEKKPTNQEPDKKNN